MVSNIVCYKTKQRPALLVLSVTLTALGFWRRRVAELIEIFSTKKLWGIYVRCSDDSDQNVTTELAELIQELFLNSTKFSTLG